MNVHLSIYDLVFGMCGIIFGIYTIVVTSKRCVPKDKMFWQGTGVVCILIGIGVITYPYILNWLRR